MPSAAWKRQTSVKGLVRGVRSAVQAAGWPRDWGPSLNNLEGRSGTAPPNPNVPRSPSTPTAPRAQKHCALGDALTEPVLEKRTWGYERLAGVHLGRKAAGGQGPWVVTVPPPLLRNDGCSSPGKVSAVLTVTPRCGSAGRNGVHRVVRLLSVAKEPLVLPA